MINELVKTLANGYEELHEKCYEVHCKKGEARRNNEREELEELKDEWKEVREKERFVLDTLKALVWGNTKKNRFPTWNYAVYMIYPIIKDGLTFDNEKEGETMKLPDTIVTKLVGLKYNAGPAPAGATVELVREYDFPNHIVAYSDSDLKIGSVIHTRYDADIVDGIPNNDELIDIFHRYNWVVIRSNKSVAWIKGTLDVPELLPMEEEVDYKEVMKNLINLYNKHAAMHDEKACEGLEILIKQTQAHLS